ncbi:MAG: hypothetical protein AAF899_16275 [Pseudomonadota bacterium]
MTLCSRMTGIAGALALMMTALSPLAAAAPTAAMPALSSSDPWQAAEAAYASGDCEKAAPLYRQILEGQPGTPRLIAATHGLVLCVSSPEDPWEAREMMADLMPVVMQHFGPQSTGLARHHAIWAEAEVRAGALNVAWRRAEAAISAARAAGSIDPFDHAAELFRLAAIQVARGEATAFHTFLKTEFQRLASARWAAPGDDMLFVDVIGTVPQPTDTEAMMAWVRAGLEELDPRPVYLGLVNDRPA